MTFVGMTLRHPDSEFLIDDPLCDSDPIGDTKQQLYGHLHKNPWWQPSLAELIQIGEKCKVTPKKVLDLYEQEYRKWGSTRAVSKHALGSTYAAHAAHVQNVLWDDPEDE